MSESVVKDVLIKAVKELEDAGDIVVVNPLEDAVANKLFATVQDVSPNMLSASELGGLMHKI